MEELIVNWEGQLWILLDIFTAVLLSAAIGQEREKHDKPAGLRTNMIVAGATCFFVSISTSINSFFVEANMGGNVNIDTDPIRVLQAILIGISFIGAGTILKSEGGEKIKYLTTAATLLFSSSVGVAVALHAYILAIGITLISILINLLNKKLLGLI